MDTSNSALSLQQFFANRVLRVPDYQRGYAWEREQRSDFLEDLEVLAPNMEHYAGTIILHRGDGRNSPLDKDGTSYTRYDVVDGQQRLTTTVLLLDAIRRCMAGLGEEPMLELAQGIHRNYIATRDMAGQPLYKLTLGSDCDHYFRTSALSDQPGPEGPQVSSERRLADARAEFDRYLSAERRARGEEFEQWLTELFIKVTTQLRVSLYQVESSAEVGVIFEVMNNRGKPLSELEKVKNYLLYAGSKLNLTHGLARTVNNAWAEIFRQLMAANLTRSADEDRLLRAHWLTYYDPQPRAYSGSKSVKGRFDIRRFRHDHTGLLGELITYAEGLRACCVAYCDAMSPERPDSFASITDAKTRAEVRRWSSKLTRTDVVAPFLPLLLATRIRYAGEGEKYLELVKLCEAFAFRVYRLLSRRADAGQASLFRVGYELAMKSISFEEALARVRATLHQHSPTSALEAELRAEYKNWYEWAGLKYLLYEYEEYLAAQKGATPKVSWEEVRRRERQDTVEHVLPQTPASSYWRERFDHVARAECTNSLGNLTLTKDNAVYGNKPFPAKRGDLNAEGKCYAKSSLFMEQELAALEDWTPQEVNRRRERLIQWALERWEASEDGVAGSVLSGGDEDDASWPEELETATAEV